MLLRATGSEIDNRSGQDSNRFVWRSGLIIVAMLVVGAIVSQSTPSEGNPVLRSFVGIEPDTRPLLVSGDIRSGKPVSAELYQSDFSMVVGVYFYSTKGKESRCTGVLLTKTKVLTAGHCCDPVYTEKHDVVHDIKMKTKGHWGDVTFLAIAKDNNHKQIMETYSDADGNEFSYDPVNAETQTPVYDLCLITLKDGAVDANPKVKIPEANAKPPKKESFTMIGYGHTEEKKKGDNTISNEAYELYSSGAKLVDCKKNFDWAGKSWDTAKELVFCATGKGMGRNACSGDSGGPLLGAPDENGERMIYGILSDGQKPCQSGPNTYSDLSNEKFLAWLGAKVHD